MNVSSGVSWLSEKVGGSPLVHSVTPERRGWPSVPFVAIVEAYVLRALRNFEIPAHKIREAAADIREQFGSEYAWRPGASPPTALTCSSIVWDEEDDFPKRLTLRRCDPAGAEVVIDPRFA
jgi:hypothetical protein